MPHNMAILPAAFASGRLPARKSAIMHSRAQIMHLCTLKKPGYAEEEEEEEEEMACKNKYDDAAR
ncbi:hypothetical protein [Nitrososphaera viennensis]|nr:hypothetical protein [Nitrososphaera viennensis]UVS69777.1 hypothetical protein NWT39_03075 [Nitrososphaera viennensis]